jgi:hypothetical protein
MAIKIDKDLYSKEKIQAMIFDNSLIKEYQKLVNDRNTTIGIIATIAGFIIVGLPTLGLLYMLYSSVEDNISGNIKTILLGGGAIILGGFIIYIIVGTVVAVTISKLMGKVPTFREFSEPVLLGYELALKRFEVENKIQDLEFTFHNKEFFHGLQVIQSLLKTRTMELENQIKMIPIEKQRAENEIFTAILERKLENEKQRDWLKDQMGIFEKL